MIKRTADSYFKGSSIESDISVIDMSEIEQRIEAAKVKGETPDVIMLSPEYVKICANKGVLMPLSELGLDYDSDRYYDFAMNAGTVNNKLYSICMHASPGIFVYRRSMANAYLGTDDPERIESLMSNWSDFLNVAQVVKAASLGETYITAGTDDISRSYFRGNFNAISENDIEEYFSFVKVLFDEGYVYGTEQWSEAWLQGFNDSKSIFGYFLSDISFKDVLCTVSEESFGDWAAVVPFSNYTWGGAYLSVYAESDNASDAAEIIRLLTVNEAAMTDMSFYSGIFTANRSVNEAVANSSQLYNEMLGGQDYYGILSESAMNINGGAVPSVNDVAIISLLDSYAYGYVSGEYEIADAVNMFMNSLKSFAG